MAKVVVDIGSKVVRGLDEHYTEIFKFEHSLGHRLNQLGPNDEYKDVLTGRSFETFVSKIITPLNRHHKKFGIEALHVVATGDFQDFNKLHPAEFSCAVYAKSIQKGGIPIFPLVYRDDLASNPQTKYALIIESALVSEHSKTSLVISGLNANVIVLRGSGVSLIQIQDPINIAPQSMPVEFRYDIRVSGSDTLRRRKSFKSVVQFYAKQLSTTSISNKAHASNTILVGKAARDIIEFKLNLSLSNQKHFKNLDSVLITRKIAKELYDKVQNQIDSKNLTTSDKKRLYRIRNGLAFIAALINCGKFDHVILSDAKFSVGLVATQGHNDKTFHKTMAKLGVSSFFDTFLLEPDSVLTQETAPDNAVQISKYEQFARQVRDDIARIQSTLDASGIQLEATELFKANKYPYISDDNKIDLLQNDR